MMKCNVEQVEVATLSHMKGSRQTQVCFPWRTAGIDHKQSSDSCDIDHRKSSGSCAHIHGCLSDRNHCMNEN